MLRPPECSSGAAPFPEGNSRDCRELVSGNLHEPAERQTVVGLRIFEGARLTVRMHSNAITVYGVCVLTFMMATYMLERRHRRFILAFALDCLLSSFHGFLSGAWPFGIVEAIWSAVAIVRFCHPPANQGQQSEAHGIRGPCNDR